MNKLSKFSEEELKEQMKKLKRYMSDSEFFYQNYEGLRRKYPDEWIAVFNQKIIAHHRDYNKLIEKLKEIGIDIHEVYIDRTYFKEKRPKLLLAQLD